MFPVGCDVGGVLPIKDEGIANPFPLTVSGVINFRDIGGVSCAGGTIRFGVLFRSSEWTFATKQGQQTLASLGLSHVVDLRSEPERQWRNDPIIPGVTQLTIDVLGNHHAVSRLAMVLLETAARDSTDSFHLEPLLSDPNFARQVLGEGQAHARFLTAYRSFCDSDQARSALGVLMKLLAEGNRLGIHCAVGKDRTGWAIASILWYLGVTWEDIVEDYLKSNKSLEFATSRVLERVSQLGGDPKIIEPMLVVREEYLMEFREAVMSRFGSVTAYV